MRWRVLPLRRDDPFMSMALDEAILKLNSLGKSPNTLRFWTWCPSAVSIGYFQSVELEVDLEAARERGVEVVRRITGGGAVFHDKDGELTYSLVCGGEDLPADILESYRKVCAGLVAGLRKLGLQAEFRPVNDVLVGGRKISGSAQTRRWGSVLQHGTILLDPDFQVMFQVLRVGREKISDKGIASPLERVTSVARELGRCPAVEEVREAMIMGFSEALDVRFEEGDLSAEEMELALQLREKYSSREWTHRR
ncbi:MAG: biotin/lipoate A/B protein ligase family protein [Candidatus Hadarchaeales archaeon]